MPQFESLNAVVYGLSPDSVAAHRRFAEKKSLALDLLSDPERGVLRAFDAWGKKKMYGKEYEGVIRSTVVIDPQGLVRHHWPKASTKGHAAQVLEVLGKLAPS
jgi:peroxiredoxin Q/BCP